MKPLTDSRARWFAAFTPLQRLETASTMAFLWLEKLWTVKRRECRAPTRLWAFALAFALLRPESLLACATCYGASDSPLAQGMNWGILTLLGVVFSVMCGIVGFFVHVGRRSKHLAGSPGQ